MAALDNPKHERFAQLVAKGGKTYTACYQEVYGAEYDTAASSASDLLRNPKIYGRVEEIQ